jgi:acyl-CoA synthetase (AMP-forming)/AMP-acid ligase II
MAVHMRWQDLAELGRYQAAVRPERVAITFGERETTYGQLDRRANRVANGLREICPAPEARVASVAKNLDIFYEVLFGAAKARDVVVPVSWRLAAAEVAFIVNDAMAEVLFVGHEMYPLVAQIRSELRTVRKIIALDDDHPEWDGYTEWRDRQDVRDPQLPVAVDDVVMQLYTSGTTGHPKGAQLTHDNFIAALQVASEWYPCTAQDVSLACMPQFHIGGSLLGLIPLHVGARNVILAEPIPAEILRLIPKEQVTLAFFVPALMLFLLQTPGCRAVDFSSLRRVVYGASPIPLDLLRDALATFKCEFGHLYGLTETTGVVTLLRPEEHDPAGSSRMRSCGKPLSNAEIKVVAADGAELPPGLVGEITVRSRQVMKGYWKLPKATASTISDGWLHTGDAGYFDSDGFLYIHDRMKDMIISGGENIYPAEVENALFGHPAIADVAVIGVPDDQWGEAVQAVVVLRAGAAVSAEELITYCRGLIAHYKAPRSVEFVESLPRNASGKLLKRVLRSPYWEGRERQVN